MSKKRVLVVNDQNQLIIDDELIPGLFVVTKKNSLIYKIRGKRTEIEAGTVSSDIELSGIWELNNNHDLVFHLKEDRRFAPSALVLKTDILETQNQNCLTFILHSKNPGNFEEFSLMKLLGIWQADQANRLMFCVSNNRDTDELIFSGSWELDKNQQISYTYRKQVLRRSIKTIRTIVFEGYWSLQGKNRLIYSLTRASDSRFEFQVQIGSANIYPQAGQIKYRIGIGVVSSIQEKIICLNGRWILGKKGGIFFEIEYAGKVIKNLEFGGNLNISDRNKATIALIDKQDRPWGVALTFTREFLSSAEGESFIRLRQYLNGEKVIEAGAAIRF